jgi:hypothetical protein
MSNNKEQFLKVYQLYLNHFDRSRNTISRDRYGKLTSFSVMDSYFSTMTSNIDSVFYTDQWQLVFGHVREYLLEKDKTTYNKIDWNRTPIEIVEDMYGKH